MKLPLRIVALLGLLILGATTFAKSQDAMPTAEEYLAIKKLAEAGDISGTINAGICAREGIGRDRNYDDAFKLFSKAADNGDALGMFYLAISFESGKGTAKDAEQAFSWAKKSSDKGNPKGKALLGQFYSVGTGTKISGTEAFRLASEAAKSKDGYAEAVLGSLYGRGIGTPKDEDAAFRLFKLSADKGTRLGLSRLGEAYARGKGTSKDLEQAAQCWQKAVAQGHTGAMMQLAAAYTRGEGVDQSYEKAKALAEAVVESDSDGSPYGAALLAHLYQEGLGVEKSPAQVAKYLRMSAAAGHIGSMNNYAAACLMPGSGVLADRTLAAALYMVAAAKGDEIAKKNIANTQPMETPSFSYSKASAIARSIMQSLDAHREIEELQEGWNSEMVGKGGSGAGPKEGRKGRVSLGSGLVFTPEGHVFTNHHVIEDGTSFEVYIPTLKKKMPAKLVVSDAANDLAILQVEGWKAEKHSPALPPPIASSTKAKVGDKVFAIGFPLPGALSTDAKYTSGDVSSLSGVGDDKRVIQISAPIQPGNSGGPLALTDGRIVGIVVATLNYRLTLKESGSLPQNVNFAVKSDYLRILAANSGVDIPDDLKVTGSPVDHVSAFSVQVISTH